MTAAPTIGFLHTAEVHRATFQGLVAELAPGAGTVAIVDPGLLAAARADGITEALRERIAQRLRALAADAGAIVCTCSTLAGVAEEFGAAVPVVRVDRPMAEAAVHAGRRVTVVAALASTLAPTRALLAACAHGRDVELTLAPCPEAWPRFEAGDLDGYAACLAAHVRAVAAAGADVIVLAQASMAPVEPLVADLGIPVLSSPRPAVAAALRLAGCAVSG